jgi:hypothetical protein
MRLRPYLPLLRVDMFQLMKITMHLGVAIAHIPRLVLRPGFPRSVCPCLHHFFFCVDGSILILCFFFVFPCRYEIYEMI